MTKSSKTAPVIAAIDVGTNSFHMVTASVNNRGMLNVISRDKVMVRLGQSPRDMKYLTEDAIQRGVETLEKFAKIAQNEKAKIRAVATSAVREAANKKDFIEQVHEKTGVDVEVVSGAEEGRLIYIGVIHSLPVYKNKTLLIDIGGGSTETVVGTHGAVDFVNSEKIGAIRMTTRFFNDAKPVEEQIQRCRNYIQGEWYPALRKVEQTGFETVIGTSGTIQTLASMQLTASGKNIPDALNGVRLTRSGLRKSIKDIVKAGSTEKRAALPGMDAKRADIILGGSLILEQFMELLNIDTILISSYALREGIVYDTFQKIRSVSDSQQLSRLRYQSVYNLCRHYDVDLNHAEHVKELALTIFDKLKPLHGLGSHDREMLESAALLHDTGYIVSHDKHHKHSYYLITNSNLPGFTDNEKEFIANLARYHRKSHPKIKHSNYSKLSKEKQQTVPVLAGILRIAEGIDRRLLQNLNVDGLHISNNNIKIYLNAIENSVSPDIEIWGAHRRKPLLESALKKNISFFLKN